MVVNPTINYTTVTITCRKAFYLGDESIVVRMGWKGYLQDVLEITNSIRSVNATPERGF